MSLHELTYLNVGNNNFTGILPSDFNQLIKLQVLDLSNNNRLRVYSSNIDKLINLTQLLLVSTIDTGTIPYSFCNLTRLSVLTVPLPSAACYPACLNSITNKNFDVANICTPSHQDIALCSFIAATNIQIIKSEWSCNNLGFTNTNPCLPFWSGISCNINNSIININLQSFNLVGKLYIINFMFILQIL